MTDDLIPLPRLTRELRDLTGDTSISYARCYRGILNGILPFEVRGSRYSVHRADLPKIAAALGLTQKSRAAE